MGSSAAGCMSAAVLSSARPQERLPLLAAATQRQHKTVLDPMEPCTSDDSHAITKFCPFPSKVTRRLYEKWTPEFRSPSKICSMRKTLSAHVQIPRNCAALPKKRCKHVLQWLYLCLKKVWQLSSWQVLVAWNN